MYRKIDPRMWTDEAFAELEPVEKLIAIYCITAQSNRCGLFRFSMAKAAEDTGVTPDSYDIAMGKVCHTLAWKYDNQRRVLYLPTWFKYNPPENPKHLEGCLKDLHDLPQTHLLEEFARNTEYIPPHCTEAFGIAMQIAMANQELKLKQKLNSKSASADLPADAGPAATRARKSNRDAASSTASPTAASRKEPTGPHHALIRFFCDRWSTRYGEPYAFNGGKDGAHVKWILTACGLNEELGQRVVQAFLDDEDPFIADKAHPIGLLKSNFNKYRVIATRGANHESSSRARAVVPRRKPTAAERGEFQQTPRPLPVVRVGSRAGGPAAPDQRAEAGQATANGTSAARSPGTAGAA